MLKWEKPEVWELDVKNTECEEIKKSGTGCTPCPTGTWSWSWLFGWVYIWFAPPKRTSRRRRR